MTCVNASLDMNAAFTSINVLGKQYESIKGLFSFVFGVPLLGFYKTAELGGYMGAREADAEAWGK